MNHLVREREDIQRTSYATISIVCTSWLSGVDCIQVSVTFDQTYEPQIHNQNLNVPLDGRIDQNQHGSMRYYQMKVALIKKFANVHEVLSTV